MPTSMVTDNHTDSRCMFNFNTKPQAVLQCTAKNCNAGSDTIQSSFHLTSKYTFVFSYFIINPDDNEYELNCMLVNYYTVHDDLVAGPSRHMSYF